MVKYQKFKLPYNYSERETSSILNENIVIVSIFGKSSYLASSCKADFVDKLLGYNVFRQSVLEDAGLNSEILCDVDGYFDKRERIIYLHLRGSYDTHSLMKILDEYSVQLEEKGYLSIWSDLKYKYARAVLFLFLVSHIVIVTHPTYVFDLSYIQLFRVLDAVRLKVQNKVVDAIKEIPNIPKVWINNGRFCTPRLLFYFEKAPLQLRTYSINNTTNIKTLEHAIEDQIYRVLKKSKIVGPTSGNTLFAIPANQEFVFVNTNEDHMQDWKKVCVNSLVNICFDPNSVTKSNYCSFGFEAVPETVFELRGRNHTMKCLLQEHVDTAFISGFDDNLGRHSGCNNFFQICKARIWFEAANRLFDYLICHQVDVHDPDSSDSLKMLHTTLDIDQRFSEARCRKVFPLAIKAYQENSPSHYTREYHESKVDHALSVFCTYARGPFVVNYIPKLQKECEKYWKSGRQMCEVLSLTGNPCNLPLHKGGSGESSVNEPDESVNIIDLPVMEHSSGVRYVSSCNCGRVQNVRDDPFSVRAANYQFYENIKLEGKCGCGLLERIEFPVFKPSTKDYKAAKVLSTTTDMVIELPKDTNMSLAVTEKADTEHGTHELTFAAYPFSSSIEPSSDIMLRDDRRDLQLNGTVTHRLNKVSPSTSLTPSMQNIVIQVTDTEIEANSDKNLIRQPSTTEYLPGMLHSESPAGLLPQFPSWSLVCIGSSSIYSHSIGLPEQYSVGFIAGSAYLLPWDVTVRLEHHTKERFWSQNERNKMGNMRLNRRKGTKEFNVKIFVGVEYECPRGHRFTCCSPDKILKATGSGIVRDNGNKVTNSDMPLYFPCPCRNVKPLIAQLLRIHIVTPKAPVYVTLNPRVQPAPSPCPIFITGCTEPIRLTRSSYWILRLPSVYCSDRGPLIPPSDSMPPMYGKLLSGMYGIAEMSPDA